MADIDWTDPKAQISDNFTVKDALYLPSWQIFHTPSDEEKTNILNTAAKMELVRAYLEKPLNVHCWIRPSGVNCPGPYFGMNYNSAVGGAVDSPHIYGMAVDFNPISMTCGEGRTLLESMLTQYDIRMENRNGNWIHIDIREPEPGHPRFFIP